jgi:hypothetical protein
VRIYPLMLNEEEIGYLVGVLGILLSRPSGASADRWRETIAAGLAMKLAELSEHVHRERADREHGP